MTVRKLIILLLLILGGCGKKREPSVSAEKYLQYRISELEKFVVNLGRPTQDVDLQNKMHLVLNCVEEKGVFAYLSCTNLDSEDKKELEEYLSSACPNATDQLLKIAIVDFYFDKIRRNYFLFDHIEPLVLKYGTDSIRVFLHAESTTLLPNIYLSKGDSALCVRNIKHRNPVSISLSEICYQEYNKPIHVEKNVFGYYSVKMGQTDCTMTIKEENIINVRK